MKITIEDSGNTLTMDMPNANCGTLAKSLVRMLPSITQGMQAVTDAVTPVPVCECPKRRYRCSIDEGRSSCEIDAADDFDAAALAAEKILPNQRAPWRVLAINENAENGDAFDFLCESGDRMRLTVTVSEEVA